MGAGASREIGGKRVEEEVESTTEISKSGALRLATTKCGVRYNFVFLTAPGERVLRK